MKKNKTELNIKLKEYDSASKVVINVISDLTEDQYEDKINRIKSTIFNMSNNYILELIRVGVEIGAFYEFNLFTNKKFVKAESKIYPIGEMHRYHFYHNIAIGIQDVIYLIREYSELAALNNMYSKLDHNKLDNIKLREKKVVSGKYKDEDVINLNKEDSVYAPLMTPDIIKGFVDFFDHQRKASRIMIETLNKLKGNKDEEEE